MLSVILVSANAGIVRAAPAAPARFKSPSGRYELQFEGVDEHEHHRFDSYASVPAGQKAQYILYFYLAGSSAPVTADWYTDADPPKPPAEIAATLLWSPQEDFVVVTHGQNAKAAGLSRWAVSMGSPTEYGFEGDHLHWIDRYRLIADLKTPKVPGGIELIDVQQHHAELVVPPRTGFGYEIAALLEHRVTVREFLNHWGDDDSKTTWNTFTPGCFDLNLDTMKKNSVTCPKP